MARRAFNPHLNQREFRNAVRNHVNMAVSASDSVVEEGINWYPRVHDVARNASRQAGIPERAGYGMVAAVSPSMDFENQNIHAIQDLVGLTTSEWDMVSRSASQPSVLSPSGRPVKAKRIPEVSAMLSERAPNVASATDANLLKAHAIAQGQDYDEVLPRRTNPKVNAFAHTMEDPDLRTHNYVTIDGRQHDILANEMQKWKADRGLDSADLPSGKPTRYEDMELATHVGHEVTQDIDPRYRGTATSAGQATTWVVAGLMERDSQRFPLKSGQPRKQGVFRQGQPYIP